MEVPCTRPSAPESGEVGWVRVTSESNSESSVPIPSLDWRTERTSPGRGVYRGSALAPSLVESVLFGPVKGVFPSAKFPAATPESVKQAAVPSACRKMWYYPPAAQKIVCRGFHSTQAPKPGVGVVTSPRSSDDSLPMSEQMPELPLLLSGSRLRALRS